MKTLDILSMGLRNLLRRKTRTFLTVIGVVVGATAIVIMVSLGIGMNESLDKMIANMGDLTIIELQSYTSVRNGEEWSQFENKLDDALVEQIKQMDEVLAVTPYIEMWDGFSIYAGKKFQIQWANITGIDPLFLPYMNIETERGEMPDVNSKSFMLFSEYRLRDFQDPNKPIRDWYKEFYNEDGTPKPPKVDVLTQKVYMQGRANNYTWDEYGNYIELESSIRFKKYTFEKIGIMKSDDRNWETQYTIFVDINTVKSLQLEIEKSNRVSKKDSQIGKYNRIKIKVADIHTAEIVQDKLSEMGVTVYNYLADTRDQLQEQQATTQMILGGIGAMSLIVAAIGIANTMFMSIYERTKEIGVMKVLGCPLFGIKSMFLFEASIIGFLGGLIGVGISLAGSYAMNNVPIISNAFRNMSGSASQYYSYYGDDSASISVIPLWLMGAAIIFSTVIGLLSGYLPARRATKISALEAIRNE